MVLDSSLSMPLSRRYSVSPYLCHRVGGISTYKYKEYFVRRVSGMIQEDKKEQESNDKELRG